VAATNAARHGVRLDLRCGHWWEPLADRRFDLAVSNPPYVAAGDPHLEALRHEPRDALVAGSDGLAALREIVAAAPAHLNPGGWLLLEHGHDQGEPVRSLLVAAGFEAVDHRRDLAGIVRCSGGRWPGSGQACPG
jgi:release factor glutamine methyltransferase